jgi:hypothetical protein
VLCHDFQADRLGQARSFGKARFGIAIPARTIAPFGLNMQDDSRDAAPDVLRGGLAPGGTQAVSSDAGSTS